MRLYRMPQAERPVWVSPWTFNPQDWYRQSSGSRITVIKPQPDAKYRPQKVPLKF